MRYSPALVLNDASIFTFPKLILKLVGCNGKIITIKINIDTKGIKHLTKAINARLIAPVILFSFLHIEKSYWQIKIYTSYLFSLFNLGCVRTTSIISKFVLKVKVC